MGPAPTSWGPADIKEPRAPLSLQGPPSHLLIPPYPWASCPSQPWRGGTLGRHEAGERLGEHPFPSSAPPPPTPKRMSPQGFHLIPPGTSHRTTPNAPSSRDGIPRGQGRHEQQVHWPDCQQLLRRTKNGCLPCP